MLASVVLGFLAAGSFVIAILQWREKGFPLNNAYLYASRKERETMNKKPYYRQTGVVFALTAIIFLLLALEERLETGWLFHCAGILSIILVVYAIISSITIRKKRG